MLTTTLNIPHLLAIFGLPSQAELLILLVLGLILFGRRLPEVGRSLGRSIVEFKKGIKGIEDEIDTEVNQSESRRRDQIEDRSRRETVAREDDAKDFAHAEPRRSAE